MPESRFSRKTQQAIKKFTDRIEPFRAFNKWIDAIAAGSITRKALVYYGVGGIGKTRLISELMSDLEKRNNINGTAVNIIFASMDVNEYNSPSTVLMGLRKQIKFPCVLFDYGMVKYMSSIGKNADQIKEFIPKSSIIWDITGDILEAIHIPVGLIDKIAIKLREKYSIQFKEYHNEIEAIDSCKRNPEELSERLPHLLGIDISVAAKNKNSMFSIFLDSYESLYRRQTFQLSNGDPDEFIQELLLSSEKTLFVIGSREYIKWEQKDPSWNEILDQHILDYLSDQDSDYFLRSVPIPDESIRKSIIESSRGLPLYLDLCVEIYLRNKNNSLSAYDFLIPTNEIIPRFLSHLSEDERTLFTALSYIHFFNFNIFEILIRELNIPIALSDFEEITDHSFVLKVENLDGIYKVHDNFYEYVINNPTVSGKSMIMDKIFSGIINYLNENKKSIPYDSMVVFYPNVMNLLSYLPEPSIAVGEKFIELSIYLIDAGYWNTVGAISGQILKKRPQDERIQFLFAVYLRRTGRLENSIKMLESINTENALFGNYKDYISYFKADTLRVMGRYSDALKLFIEISEKNNNGSDKELYLKCQNQIGDLTFLFGKFSDALGVLESACTEGNVNSILFAETLRIEGHIYRFNFMLDDALGKYINAMELARKFNILGLQGKLYNNLAESYCWLDPDKALEYGEKSIDINKNLNAPVEYGKTYAAMSIASSMKGDFSSSLKYSDLALSTQEQVKYLGGIVYAYGSYCFMYIKKGDKDKFLDYYNKMKKLVGNLGALEYTMLPYYLYLNAPELQDISKNIQWIDYGKTLEVVKSILKI